jgi:chemotaxis protein MotA
MFAIIGVVVVTVCVLGGYLLEGGNILVLWQPIELLIIMGAAIGGLLIVATPHLLKEILHHFLLMLKPPPASKEKYIQLTKCLYELFKLAAGNPLAIEPHVENPETSEIFKRYPLILEDHHLLPYIANSLSMQISANLEPHVLEDLLDNDIKTMHDEENEIPTTVNRLSDALPGLGIVAAVLGIVITMGKLQMGKEVIGHSVAAALVGTFLGILFSYGYFQPFAAKMASNINVGGKLLSVAKAGILAWSKGLNAQVCVEFIRRSIPMEYRITYKELDELIQSIGKGG